MFLRQVAASVGFTLHGSRHDIESWRVIFFFHFFCPVAPGQLQFVRLIVVCFVVGVGRWAVRRCFSRGHIFENLRKGCLGASSSSIPLGVRATHFAATDAWSHFFCLVYCLAAILEPSGSNFLLFLVRLEFFFRVSVQASSKFSLYPCGL